ncbi:MAG: M23 family metallopeptidase [Candidatus Sabulitectum sp.]|nr:M23 family metallopeptidase [Candidatus Sabulitectum sp.]
MLRNRRNWGAVALIAAAIAITLIFTNSSDENIGEPWGFHRDIEAMDVCRTEILTVVADTIDIFISTIGEGFLGGAVRELGISGGQYLATCHVLMDSLGWTVQRTGDTLTAVYCRGELTELRAYPGNRRGFYRIAYSNGDPSLSEYVPQERWIRQRAVSCEVSTTVWAALWDTALPPDLTESGLLVTCRDSSRAVGYISELQRALTDRLFVYDIDFYYDVRVGDSLWILIEENRYPMDGETGFRRILAAKYQFAYGGIAEAFPFFHRPEEAAPAEIILDHYHRDGASLRTMFLKMPVPFGRISSGYSSSRMHPVLGYTRAHRGIDYASPLGTEIYAVGDGTITVRSWCGGYGNMVRVRHANGYETGYGHMNGYASGQSVGSYVRQGEIIGYVGSTGLSTGPHVHFEMKRNGSYVNPATEIMPPADPLDGEELERFLAEMPVIEAQWSMLAGMDLPIPEVEIEPEAAAEEPVE